MPYLLLIVEKRGHRATYAPEAARDLYDQMVGGFFMIDVASRDEAVAIASRCPAVNWATVEVRECSPCHVL